MATNGNRTPNKHILWKEELEKRGANIVIKAADVTKKQDMINLRNHILGAMPPSEVWQTVQWFSLIATSPI